MTTGTDELGTIVTQLEQQVDTLIQERDDAVANQGVSPAEVADITGKVQRLYDRVTQALR